MIRIVTFWCIPFLDPGIKVAIFARVSLVRSFSATIKSKSPIFKNLELNEFTIYPCTHHILNKSITEKFVFKIFPLYVNIYLFSIKHLLSTYFVLSTVLGTEMQQCTKQTILVLLEHISQLLLCN